MKTLFATCLCSLLVLGCRTNPGSTTKDTNPDGPQFSGIQLKMSGNPKTGKITAKFLFQDAPFSKGQKVKLVWDVVKSRESLVNCSALRHDAEVNLAGEGEEGSFEAEVDPKLFDDFLHPDPAGVSKVDWQAFQKYDGPARVEGCLLKPEGEKQLTQDGMVQGETADVAASGLNLQDGPAGPLPEIVKYGQICADKLGPIPSFSCNDDGQVLPITVTQPNGTVTTPTTPVPKCDRPIYLGTGDNNYCKPFARIGRLKTKEGVETTFICRQYGQVPGADHPLFNDVAIVQHSTVTGETCWFQALSSNSGPLYGKRVPPPTELVRPDGLDPRAKNAEQFWLTPQGTAGINCVNCHDSDPFMHSPYVDQVRQGDSTLVASSPRSKYIMLGPQFGFGNWPTAYNVTPSGNALCDTCHRIGSLNTCETWVRDSSNRNPFQKTSRYLKNQKTPNAGKYPLAYWMPPPDGQDVHHTSVADWNEIAGPAYANLEKCCNSLGTANPFGSQARYGKKLTKQQIDDLAAQGCGVQRTTFMEGDTNDIESGLPLDTLKLPDGFKISVYAMVKGARSLELSPNGTLFVGTGGFSNPDNKVYAVRDEDGDGVGERVFRLANGLDNPNAVTFKDGDLYIAERTRVSKMVNIENNLANPPQLQTVNSTALPTGAGHSWRYMRAGPDGKLYIGVGSNGNIHAPDPKYARIIRMNTDGSGVEDFAKGVRNTVGFDWEPGTGDFWFTDNGRDALGDNLPPDELNRATAAGQHFGHPSCHGTGIVGTTYPGAPATCDGFVAPARDLGPHVAALGMRFYTGSMFPAAYKNAIFVAEHGSWNRQDRIGYRLMIVRPGNNGLTYETFATGWLGNDQSVWGRPVDVQVMPDGALLLSDDKAGAIYRITYQGH